MKLTKFGEEIINLRIQEEIALDMTKALIKQGVPLETKHPIMDVTLGEIIRDAGLTEEDLESIRNGEAD